MTAKHAGLATWAHVLSRYTAAAATASRHGCYGADGDSQQNTTQNWKGQMWVLANVQRDGIWGVSFEGLNLVLKHTSAAVSSTAATADTCA